MEPEKNSDVKSLIKKAVQESNPDASPDTRKKCEQVMIDVIENGKTPAEAMGLGEVELDTFYGIAYNLYQGGKYEQAKNIFFILSNLDGGDPKYWYGLAACNHKLNNFEKAREYYLVWSFLEPENPTPLYHASDCWLRLDLKREAIICLLMVINRCGDLPAYQKMKEKAKATQEKLKEEVGWDKKD